MSTEYYWAKGYSEAVYMKNENEVWHIFKDRKEPVTLCGITFTKRLNVGHPVSGSVVQLRIDNCGECIMEYNRVRVNIIPEKPLEILSRDERLKLQAGFKILYYVEDDNLDFVVTATVIHRQSLFGGLNPKLSIKYSHKGDSIIEHEVSIYSENILKIVP
jgi:hypothetical protein